MLFDESFFKNNFFKLNREPSINLDIIGYVMYIENIGQVM
jgi:hypothetical protein